jgi:hypothetical protein
MSYNDASISIVATEARAAMPKDGTMEAKAEAAMRSAANHWMVLDPELQLKGALGALLLEYPEASPEGTRLRAELKAMQKLSAIIQASRAGIPINLESIAAEPTPDFERIGLADIWQRISKGA